MKNLIILLVVNLFISGCGKVGPLSLPEEKLNKSIISYPCDETCMENFEEEKKRQQSVAIQSE